MESARTGSPPDRTGHTQDLTIALDTPGDHTVTQGFTDGLLTSVSQFATSITYHPDGLWATVVHSNDVTDHQDVDATGMPRPARLSTSGASENFDTGTYAYDGAGNIKAMGSFSYVYDLLSRVQDAQVEVPKPGCGEVNYVQNKKDTGDATYTSCGTVQAGPSYTVGATGDVTLQAGHAVVLANGFSVESGGRLTAGVDPNLDPAGLPTPAEQSYVYDAFGNLTSITTTFGGGSGQPSVMRTMPSDSRTNRLSGLTYDDSGNVTSWLTSAYAYDPFNMMTEADSTEGHFDFVYGPGDERLWVIDWTNGSSFSDWVETWTLRDINGSPLRQYRITGGNTEKLHWSADPEFPKDYAWRGGSLLGSVTAEGVVRHFHLDHLGSPRVVTDSSRHTLALHLYFPFGEEATDPSQDSLKLKFTGHERDDLRLGTTYDLDYMHARYYSPQIGRFFSTDPLAGSPGAPQSWNLYSYTLGNPVNYTDPYGLQLTPIARFDDYINAGGTLFDYSASLLGFEAFGDFLRNLSFFNNLSSPGSRLKLYQSLHQRQDVQRFFACLARRAASTKLEAAGLMNVTQSGDIAFSFRTGEGESVLVNDVSSPTLIGFVHTHPLGGPTGFVSPKQGFAHDFSKAIFTKGFGGGRVPNYIIHPRGGVMRYLSGVDQLPGTHVLDTGFDRGLSDVCAGITSF